MISRKEIEEVIEQTKTEGKTLTIYISINPASFGDHSRGVEINLNSIEHELKARIPKEEKPELEENLQKIPHLIQRLDKRPRSAIVVLNYKKGVARAWGLQIHVKAQAFWEKGAALTPLLNWLDEYERHVVILADRVKARLFEIYMNEIDEFETLEIEDHKDVQRTQASGLDHLRSQMQHQRLADTHALWHFKRAVDLLTKSGTRLEFDRLLLAGPKTSAAEIEKLLPKELTAKLAGRLSLSIHAEPQEVLQAVIKAGEELERQEEKEIVNDLITMAHKQDKAVLGFEAVNAALSNGQVARLVYTPASEPKMEDWSSRVLAAGGELEQVKGAAAESLNREGGIGAYLRYKI